MINESSSGDHFDCFLAGASAIGAGAPRLAGMEDGADGTEATDVDGAKDAVGAVTGGPVLGGTADELVTRGGSSSSWGFRSNEISTLAGDMTGWFCTAIICATR